MFKLKPKININDFKIFEKIGEGSFGVVYLVKFIKN